MKTCTLLFKSLFIVLFFFAFTFTSCDVDDFFGGTKPKFVKTIVGDEFPANDGLYVTPNGKVLASNLGVFDPELNKYNGTTVYEVSRNGQVSSRASGFEAPMASALDSQGNLYFNTENNNDVVSGVLVKVSPDGSSSSITEIAGWPSGIAINNEDIIYVANFFAPTMHKVMPDGTTTILATDDRLFGCVGIDIDNEGNIITSNFFTADILKVTPDGEVSLIAKIPNTTQGFAIGYMTIFEGAIYATGISQNVIYKVNFDGTTSIFAGTGENESTDGKLDEATFSQPNGIAADERRRILYISQFDKPGLRAIKF